jgi:hypothetical protein
MHARCITPGICPLGGSEEAQHPKRCAIAGPIGGRPTDDDVVEDLA